jgi:hypothetical protein
MGVNDSSSMQGGGEGGFGEAWLSRQWIGSNIENRLHACNFEAPDKRFQG